MTTNFEHYKEEIKALDYDFAVYESDGKPEECDGIRCNSRCNNKKGCLFFPKCTSNTIKWLYEEHIEKPTLTLNERKFCEILQYKYIVRDKYESLWAFENRPCKDEEDGAWKCNETSYSCVDRFMLGCNFSFIKWEDDRAWSVEDLLKLEVAE